MIFLVWASEGYGNTDPICVCEQNTFSIAVIELCGSAVGGDGADANQVRL